MLDTLFYDLVDIRKYPSQVRLPYGSEHPDTVSYAGFKLVNEQVVDYKWVKRWWCNTPSNQDWYNYSIDYSAGDITKPIFKRRYLVRRDVYIPATKSLPFGSVYLFKVTNGGTNYTEPPTVALTGGGGAGATARAVVNLSGQVAWVLLVTEGTGYTSPPAVGFSGGGAGAAGAAASAIVQGNDCYLVDEDTQELPADDPRRSLYLIVRKTFETLPGPLIEEVTGYEEETGALEERFTQRDFTASVSIPSRGTEYPAASGLYVMDAKFKVDENNKEVGTLIVDVMAPPDPRTEYVSQNYPVPRVVTSLGVSWPLPPANASCPTGPYNGVNYLLTVRTPCSPLKRVISYGIPGTLPFTPVSPVDSSLSNYAVSCTPASASRLPITEQTIHDGFTVTFNPGAVVVDFLPASTPATYVAGDHVIDVAQGNWKSAFEKRIVTHATFPA